MQTVEDALSWLMNRMWASDPMFKDTLKDPWYARFIPNVFSYVQQNKPLSTEQARIILRILARVSHQAGDDREAVEEIIRHPIYKRVPFQSASIPREVRYLGDNKLGFRFKMNDVIIQQIKALAKKEAGVSNDAPVFNRASRVWVVPVTAQTIDAVMEIIRLHRFDIDDPTVEYLALCVQSKDQESSFFFDPETGKIVANVCDNELINGWIKGILSGEIL